MKMKKHGNENHENEKNESYENENHKNENDENENLSNVYTAAIMRTIEKTCENPREYLSNV